MHFIQGDVQTLRVQAQGLLDIASAVRQVQISLNLSPEAVDDDEWIAGYESWEERQRNRIGQAAERYDAAAGTINALAIDLERIDSQAEAAYSRFNRPQPGGPGYFLFDLAREQLELDAGFVRGMAAGELRRLASESPSFIDTSTWGALKSTVGENIRDVPKDLSDYAKETAAGIVSLGKLSWDISGVRMITDREGWTKSWADVRNGMAYASDNPGKVSKEAVLGAVDWELAQKNPFAWGIVVGPQVGLAFFTGGLSTAAKGAVTVPKVVKSVDVAKSLNVANDVAGLSSAERIVRGLDKFTPDPKVQEEAWQRYVAKKDQNPSEKRWDRERWDEAYIRVQQNRLRGNAYRDLTMERLGLVGADGWKKEVAPQETGHARRLDFANRSEGIGYEIKSGKANPRESLRELWYDEQLLRGGWRRIEWILEEKPSQSVLLELQRMQLKYPGFKYKIEKP